MSELETDGVIGCFASYNMGEEGTKIFNSYIWHENSITDILSDLEYFKYGSDMKLILFQFYINPIPYLSQHLKEIESYRKNEKSIGIPIIVTTENFFDKSGSLAIFKGQHYAKVGHTGNSNKEKEARHQYGKT